MTVEPAEVIQALEELPIRAALVLVGADRATQTFARTAAQAATIVAATVLPDQAAVRETLGRLPVPFCPREIVLATAVHAYRQALSLTQVVGSSPDHPTSTTEGLPNDRTGGTVGRPPHSSKPVVGLSCIVAAIDGDLQKERSPYHIAAHARETTRLVVLDRSSRDDDLPTIDPVLFSTIWTMFADVRGTDVIAGHIEQATVDPLMVDVCHSVRKIVWSAAEGTLQAESPANPLGILSGSFNPLHAGHRALQTAAAHMLQGAVHFELPIVNADKPPLDYLTITRRCAQFEGIPLALTALPTFSEKAGIFPGTTFVIGVDTAERVIQPRFYDGCEKSMHEGLEHIRQQGCSFLVAGRNLKNRFLTVQDLPIPEAFADLFRELPQTEFRSDISSTDHRHQSGGTL